VDTEVLVGLPTLRFCCVVRLTLSATLGKIEDSEKFSKGRFGLSDGMMASGDMRSGYWFMEKSDIYTLPQDCWNHSSTSPTFSLSSNIPLQPFEFDLYLYTDTFCL
jgi:hypothetical protein